MARIFISYSHSDGGFVDDLVPLLNKVFPNHQIWYDEQIAGGQDWWKRILREILACDVFIFLASNDALQSPYCQAEYREALRLQKACLPVIVRPKTVIARAPGDIAAQLAVTQYINMAGGFKDYKANAALYSAIMQLLAALPSDPPPPLSPDPIVPQGMTLSSNRAGGRGLGRLLLITMGAIVIVAGIAVIGIVLKSQTTNDNPTQTETPSTQAALQASATSPASAQPFTTTPTVTPTQTQTAPATATAINLRTPVSQQFDGVEMVQVPPGCFTMGSADGEADEQPVTKQCFDAPFWIDRFEVSQAQFKRFGGQAAKPSTFLGDNRPVDRITWFEARDFCAKRGARLLTEAEWEYAARGPSSTIYPWGDIFVADDVVYTSNAYDQTAEVGSKPKGASWVGAYDMSGNVWEWVSTLYRAYPYNATDGRENLDDNKGKRVLRGGAWDSFAGSGLRSTYRGGDVPTRVSGDYGFRCGRTG